MVTHDKQIQIDGSTVTVIVTLYGLSTDEKPTSGIGNGSCFIEMDTGKGYFFDLENNEWHEQSGGSGGGGSASGMVVETTFTSEGYGVAYYISDKTAEEIASAIKAATHVVIHIPEEQSYSSNECWFSVDGYAPEWGSSGGEVFAFGGTGQGLNNIIMLDSVTIDGNGKLRIPVYVD